MAQEELVREIAAQRGMRPTRAKLHEISQQAIEQHGTDLFVKTLIARIEEKPWHIVGITGIRTPADVRVLRERFGEDFVLVHVRVDDIHTRFERIQQRNTAGDPQGYEQFQ